MIGVLRYHDEQGSLHRLYSQLRRFRGPRKAGANNKGHGYLLDKPQPLYGGVPQQGQRGPQPDHMEALVPGHAPEGLHLRVEGEIPGLSHVDLQIHQHIPLLGRRADRKLIAQMLSRSLRGLLIARIGGQDSYKKIRRIVGLRAIVAMIGEEAQRMLRRTREGHPSIGQQHHVVEVVEELRARLVDGAQDGGALLGQLVQRGHQLLGTEGVQTGGGFVAEQDYRII